MGVILLLASKWCRFYLYVDIKMPAPRYTDSIEKLVEYLSATECSTSRQFDIAKAIIEVKLQEAIAKQTNKLTVATWTLAVATIGLVLSTLALVYVSIK